MSWKWNGLHGSVDAFKQIQDSNLAGLEEEGWFSKTFYEAIRREHGASCDRALSSPAIARRYLSGNRSADTAGCPCLSVVRNALRPQQANDTFRPVFYLKLHKVGSTTVTNALMVRCVEAELQARGQALGDIWPVVTSHMQTYRRAQHAGGGYGTLAHFTDPHPTPAALEACRTLPLRISHNSLKAYVDAGRCAASSSLRACVLGGDFIFPLQRAMTLVVLRKPVSRLVSSIYFWNCITHHSSFRDMLMNTPPANLTADHIRAIAKDGRVELDEPIKVYGSHERTP